MKLALKFLALIVGIGVLFALGYCWRDIQQGRLPDGSTLTALVGGTNSGQSESPSVTFKRSFSNILTDYYKPVDAKKLKFAGMEGLMASLGDPHTMFLEPVTATQFATETSANFVGIGARLSPDPLGARVVVVFEDSPASRAGLRIGDLITGVDNDKVSGKEVDAIVSRIRGKEGTLVRLQVLRQGSAKPVQLTARRANVTVPTVESAMVTGTNIGRIGIATFSEPTADQFDKGVERLEKQGMKGLVIDLRNNPGGLLETAQEILSRFVEDKVVVTMKGRDGRKEVVRTFVGLQRKWRYPVAVLMNEDSASASEIMAGCMRDYKLATLVGEHSYGKASVQNVRPLRDGASAKITIARYFLPSGEDIGRVVDEDGQFVSGGLKPDVAVELDPNKEIVIGDIKKDAQLAKAVEVLKARM